MILGIFFTGLFTWIIGRPALHIGASGIIYMLTAFLLFKGIFSKQYQLTALSFAVIFLYGSFLWYLFPIDPEISWEGHLSGFFVGIVFSLIFRKNHLENKKFVWEHEDFDPEEDDFLKQFDEDGNFIETPKKEPGIDKDQPTIRIRYSLKQNPSKNNDNPL